MMNCFSHSGVVGAVAALTLSACATAPTPSAPSNLFMARLHTLCGQSYAGRVVSTDAADADFAGKRLIMRVECPQGQVRIPFAVGEDRSRTWVITRSGTGLRLKHDHRHADGTEDVLTRYGGDTATPGTADRQEFPADQFSKDLFTREGRTVSNTNVWAVEVRPSETFAYELRRPGGRFFRVEFDLTRPVAD